MSEKYSIGDFVVYDVYGICKIDRIENISFTKREPKRNYYVLSPVNAPTSTYYVPISKDVTDKKLRLPMSENEIQFLLSTAKNSDIEWIENRQIRAEKFNHILSQGISTDLLKLIGCIYNRKTLLAQQGKKLSATDERFFTTAENMLKEEFSFSLGIPAIDVTEYIHNFMTQE